jgi:hypothetical protein
MVRNLVLTPFIDLAFAHFMFFREKDRFFLQSANLTQTKIESRPAWIIVSACAPINLLIGASLEGRRHD